MSRYGRIIEHGGEALSLDAWAERIGIKPVTLLRRLEHGWTPAKALTTPLQHQPWVHDGEGTYGQRLTAYRQAKVRGDGA